MYPSRRGRQLILIVRRWVEIYGSSKLGAKEVEGEKRRSKIRPCFPTTGMLPKASGSTFPVFPNLSFQVHGPRPWIFCFTRRFLMLNQARQHHRKLIVVDSPLTQSPSMISTLGLGNSEWIYILQYAPLLVKGAT